MSYQVKPYEIVLYTLRDCIRDINRPAMIRTSIDLVEKMYEPHRLAHEHRNSDWMEHPKYPVVDWQIAVEENDTRLGYWQWVADWISLETEQS